MALNSFDAFKPGRHSKQGNGGSSDRLEGWWISTPHCAVTATIIVDPTPASSWHTEKTPKAKNGFSEWKPPENGWLEVGRFIFLFGDDLFPFGHFSILGIWMSGSALTKTYKNTVLKPYTGSWYSPSCWKRNHSQWKCNWNLVYSAKVVNMWISPSWITWRSMAKLPQQKTHTNAKSSHDLSKKSVVSQGL